MWNRQYDENLHKNPFFNEILKNHGGLLVRASQENWVICVPRAGVVENEEIGIDAILDHVLVPNDSIEGILYTLSNKRISIRDKEITVLSRPTGSVRILFEETFYVKNLKYVVFCLDKPLFIDRTIHDSHKVNILETLDDCIEFMWSENLSHLLIKIQKLCASFIDQNQNLAVENLQAQKDSIGSLYSQCLQIVLKNRNNSGDCDNIKLSVETYMQSCLDRTLMKAINSATCFGDANLNKIMRNSSDLQLQDFNVSPKFCDIVTNAKTELTKINNYVTILDKVNCLKLTFNHLFSVNICVTSDDILQILVFLIIKSDITNWTSNLVYLTQFQFSSLDMSNENNFLLTSLEAALEFLKSDEFCKIKAGYQTSNPVFETILTNDLAQLQDLLKHKKTKISTNMCHPLCDCDSCIQSIQSSHDVTMYNEKGQSLLAFSTVLGRTDMVEFLLSIGADVDSLDYFRRAPMHHACLKGYQDVLLILVNCKANVNIKDNDGNTPLHVACNNGHENCVKALLYTSRDLDVDCVNRCGDTPLHLAVRGSHVGIVRLLLENNAVATVPNKKNQLPLDLAQNCHTERLLRHFHAYLENHSSATARSVPKSVEQLKKIDLLLKAIENDDLPLTCFYLGFSNTHADYDFRSKCHPLCNCEKCEENDNRSEVVVNKINVNTCNIDGFTPLHFVAKYGRTELLRTLLDSKALPNSKTFKTLQTPLHLACIHRQLQVVKELLKCGDCKVDVQDYKGNTPLYYACVKNDPKIVEVLLVNGANCDLISCPENSIIKEIREKIFLNIREGKDDCL